MEPVASITSVSHVIQLAVAPVFLLSGVGAILAVLINRLGRIVDRYRFLENGRLKAEAEAEVMTGIEMAILSRGARRSKLGISLLTVGRVPDPLGDQPVHGRRLVHLHRDRDAVHRLHDAGGRVPGDCADVRRRHARPDRRAIEFSARNHPCDGQHPRAKKLSHRSTLLY